MGRACAKTTKVSGLEPAAHTQEGRFARLVRCCHAAHGRRGTINLVRIDLASIRLVVLCAETGSLSAAAKLAHLSLSGASHKLGLLQESLGAKLFERHRRGLRPTRAGRIVASNGRLMLGLLEHLVHSLGTESADDD